MSLGELLHECRRREHNAREAGADSEKEADFYAALQTLVSHQLVPTEAMLEQLARFLWQDGVVHRTPPTTWEALPFAARKHWRDIALHYLSAAFAEPT